MGFEYKIRFEVPAGFDGASLVARLPDASIPNSAWSAFDYEVEPDGFYFVDHGGKRETSSVAFRVLVDEALRHGGPVVIEAL